MHEIGVLFVHGIGQQTRGRTLLDVGGHLQDWISRWVLGSNVVNAREGPREGPIPTSPGDAQVTLESVLFEQTPDQDPAHAIIRIEVGPEDDRRSSSWLLAEAFWADSFPKPYFPEVVTWTMLVFPWILVSFIIRRVRQLFQSFDDSSIADLGQAVRWVRRNLLLVVAAMLCSPLIVVIELVLFILLLTWLIPVPAVRKYLYWLYESFAGIIGESYIFTSSELRQQAVVGSVRRQLAWLESRCEKIAIVAHSQGAAVTYLTLGTSPPDRLRVLFTFGSGLLKLSQLSDRKLASKTASVGIFSFMAASPFVILILDWLFWFKDDRWPFLTFLILLVECLPIAAMVAFAGSGEESSKIALWSRNLEKRGVRWVDAFTSEDPVPNGPLFRPEWPDRPRLPEPIRVRNRESFLTDHTTYPENMLEFVTLLATTIARDCESSIALHELTALDQAAISDVSLAQHAEVAARTRDYWLLALSGVALLWNTAFLRFVGDWITGTFASAFGWVKTVIPGANGGEANTVWSSHAMIGAACVALLLFVAKQFLDVLFNWRKNCLLSTFFERKAWDKSGYTGWLRQRKSEPLEALPHFIAALAVSIAVHSYWSTPLRVFQTDRPAQWAPPAVVAQAYFVAIGIATVLWMLDMAGIVWFRRRLKKNTHS